MQISHPVKRNEFLKENRLLNKEDFKNVFSSVFKKIGCKYFFGLLKKNNLKNQRLGIIVSKSNVKKANKRNLIKRIIKESFRLNKEKIQNMDVIVLIKKEINQLKTKKEIRREIDRLWEKIETQ